MTLEDRQLLDSIYAALMRAEASGFEASTEALRNMLSEFTAELARREGRSDLDVQSDETIHPVSRVCDTGLTFPLPLPTNHPHTDTWKRNAGGMAKHDWIGDVLEDMATYCRNNGLPETEDALKIAKSVFSSDRDRTVPTIIDLQSILAHAQK